MYEMEYFKKMVAKERGFRVWGLRYEYNFFLNGDKKGI
jgi:hypothetical protein